MPLITVDNVTKVYRARQGPDTLMRGVAGLFQHGRTRRFVALSDISFAVEAGESLGIIGANGSGKSTLLKILAGVTVPTSGTVEVLGRVASLLELGAGFHPLLTGRENIYLNAGLLGMRRAQVDEVFDQIVAFSGIEEFIDNPLNTYSSGMYVRIGFAVAVHVNPDIFLVDEVLSVGDEGFQRKCRRRIGELKEAGKTILFVSHDLSIVNTLCDRVLLLSKGRLICRETARETIDFYLRQVGGEAGVHTFDGDRVEAIMSHGRVSAFWDGREVSAPSGFQMHVECMEQLHQSTAADWEVVDRRPDGCTARGRMSRLPIILLWDLRIEAGRLIWSVALECEQETPVTAVEVNLYFPLTYMEWFYGSLTGAFPDLLPGDLAWMTVAAPELTCRDAAFIPGPDSALPPVLVFLEAHMPYLRLHLANTEYVRGARALQAGARIPDANLPLAAGRHDLMTLELDFQLTVDEVQRRIKAREAHRMLHKGPYSAAFEHGAVRLLYDGEELTTFVSLYASMLISNLWNNSHNLQWGPVERTGEHLRCTGRSRRFPFAQHWELDVVDRGIALRVWLEAFEPIEVQEYHTSIALKPAYDRWETERESGSFPSFDPNRQEWKHVNQDYAPGTYAKALSPSLPSVTLEVTSRAIPIRMTVIDTGLDHNARVLQALRTPETGLLRFEQGRHLYFSGIISVDAPEA